MPSSLSATSTIDGASSTSEKKEAQVERERLALLFESLVSWHIQTTLIVCQIGILCQMVQIISLEIHECIHSEGAISTARHLCNGA